MWIERYVLAFGSSKEHFREPFNTHTWSNGTFWWTETAKHGRNRAPGQTWTTYWLDFSSPSQISSYQDPSRKHLQGLGVTKDAEFNTFHPGIPKEMHCGDFSKTSSLVPTETKSTNFALNRISTQLILAPAKEHSPQVATSTTDVTKQNKPIPWFHSIITVITTVRFIFIRLNKNKFIK